jgi:hypothetical protein
VPEKLKLEADPIAFLTDKIPEHLRPVIVPVADFFEQNQQPEEPSIEALRRLASEQADQLCGEIPSSLDKSRIALVARLTVLESSK